MSNFVETSLGNKSPGSIDIIIDPTDGEASRKDPGFEEVIEYDAGRFELFVDEG